MLNLGDLIALANVNLQDFKIHCATGTNPTPLEAFFNSTFKEWQEEQNKRNFQCKRVLSLIHLGGDRWLFAGVYGIHDVRSRREEGKTPYLYSTSEIEGLEHLIGRVVVKFNKDFRASYLKGPKYIDRLTICEIRSQRMSVEDFPGYHSVLLSAMLLRTIIRENIPSWKAALSSVSGIYLIADTQTGKQYVGSAYGEGGIWQRWVSYAATMDGGNRELRKLLQEEGTEYAEGFQFTILEICDILTSMEYVLEREAHWKNVLCSRKFGYNSN